MFTIRRIVANRGMLMRSFSSSPAPGPPLSRLLPPLVSMRDAAKYGFRMRAAPPARAHATILESVQPPWLPQVAFVSPRATSLMIAADRRSAYAVEISNSDGVFNADVEVVHTVSDYRTAAAAIESPEILGVRQNEKRADSVLRKRRKKMRKHKRRKRRKRNRMKTRRV